MRKYVLRRPARRHAAAPALAQEPRPFRPARRRHRRLRQRPTSRTRIADGVALRCRRRLRLPVRQRRRRRRRRDHRFHRRRVRHRQRRRRRPALRQRWPRPLCRRPDRRGWSARHRCSTPRPATPMPGSATTMTTAPTGDRARFHDPRQSRRRPRRRRRSSIALGPNTFVKAEYRYSNYEQGFDEHQGVVGLGFRF